jgi:hypothetical protein
VIDNADINGQVIKGKNLGHFQDGLVKNLLKDIPVLIFKPFLEFISLLSSAIFLRVMEDEVSSVGDVTVLGNDHCYRSLIKKSR